jgi:hypothetical protein
LSEFVSRVLSAAALLCVVASGRAAEPPSFRGEVAPILLENCLACHGPKKAEGGYRVDTFDELRKPGDSGEAPVVPGEGNGGELLRRLTAADPAERMPADSEPLTAEQIDAVRRWVAAGAAFDGEKPDQPLSLIIPPPRYPDPPESYPRVVPVTALAFSPDGRQVLASGYHEVTAWNAEDGKLAGRIKNLPQRVFALAFLPDGRRLAVAGGEPGRSGEVRIVEFETGAVTAVLARSGDVALDVAVRPKTGELAVASADGLIRVVNPDAPAAVRTIASHADWVTAVAWSDDGTLLASASRDKSAKLYAGDSGDLLANYQGHGAAVRGVAFTPDGKQVLSTGADGKLHRWNVEGAGKAAEVGLGGDAFHLTRTGNFVLVPCADAQARQIDLGNNAVTRSLAGHHGWAVSAAASKDGARFATGGLDGEVRLWSAVDGTLVRSWAAKP